MLMTSAPRLVATAIALARACWTSVFDSSSYLPKLGSPRSVTTRMDSTRDWGATPSMPLDPSPWPWPAMSEAIQVPWTPQEALDGGVCTPERSGPSVTEPAMSDTEGETPLSMTATSTPWPWVTGQAD